MDQISRSSVPYTVSVAKLPQKGMPVRLLANETELKVLAKAHDLEKVLMFEADMTVRKWRADGVKVTGMVKARIIQNCIVSLEPIENTIENEFEVILVPENSRLARVPDLTSGEIHIDFEGPDVPETFSGDRIDAGALAEEFFELAIDPYPRKPGAEFAEINDDADLAPKKPSPFAKLAQLRKP
jgi:uncharacterized metal-binding protein YceD (DUF177 family)